MRCRGFKSSELVKFRGVVEKVLVKLIRIENKTTAVLRADHDTATVVIAQTIELLRVGYGQELQHHRINECKNRRGGSDTQGEREHYSSREARGFAERTNAKAHISPTRLDERFPGARADDFLRKFKVAALQTHRANGFLAAPAFPHLFRRRHFQVGAQFLVQLPVDLFLSEQRSEAACNVP